MKNININIYSIYSFNSIYIVIIKKYKLVKTDTE